MVLTMTGADDYTVEDVCPFSNLRMHTQDDFGNVERVLDSHRDIIRYEQESDTFYVWQDDRHVWVPEGRASSTVGHLVKSAVIERAAWERLWYPEEKEPGSQKTKRQLFDEWVRRQRSATRVRETVAALKLEPDLWVDPKQWDSDPWLLNTPDGAIDLRTGRRAKLTGHPLCRLSTAVCFDPTASYEEFTRFLEMVLPDPEHRAYLQTICGMSLWGDILEQRFIVMQGSGGNGKGVVGELLGKSLGDYATPATRDVFLKGRGKRTFEQSLWKNVRVLLGDELEDGKGDRDAVVDEAGLKLLSGGDKFSAEGKGLAHAPVKPKFTIFLRTNRFPAFSNDAAMRRRFTPTSWPVAPTADQWDSFKDADHSSVSDYILSQCDNGPRGVRKLIPYQHGSGFLNWMLEGLRKYREDGNRLQIPADLAKLASDTLLGSDPVASFIRDRLEPSTEGRIQSGDMLAAFDHYYLNGYAGKTKKPSRNVFYGAMREIVSYSDNTKPRWYFYGYRLIEEYPEEN